MAAPNWALSPFGLRWFNELVLLRYGRGVKRALMHPQTFFYPLDRAARLEQGLRQARLHAVPVRPAAPIAAFPSTARCSRRLPRAAAHPYLVVVKDFGAEGRGRLSFPCPGITFSSTCRSTAPHAGHRRRRQRHRRGRGRPRLPDQGRLHARRALPRDGSARRRLQRDPPALGPRRTDSQRALGAAARGRGVRKIAFVGATKGIGRAVARLLAARGDRVALLGRDAATCARQRRDLAARARPRRRRGHGGAGPGATRDLRPRARRGRPPARRLRHGRDHGGRVRHAGRARGGRRGPGARADDQLHAHDPVLRGGARAAARGAAAARSACSARSPATGPASPSSCMARRRPAWRITSRASTCVIATPGCGWCWSSPGSCGRG